MKMKGWDTISFLKIEAVNRQFAAAWREEFGHFQCGEELLEVEGCFGAPKIIPGGSGKSLRVSLPIASGHAAMGTDCRDASGCECRVAFMLHLLPEGCGQSLRFDLRQLAKTPEEADPDIGGWVLPIAFHDPQGNIPRLWRSSILDCVCQYLIEHPGFFGQLLALVTMRQDEESSWAAPEECAYAYLDGTPPTLCVLGVSGFQRQSELPLTIDPPASSAVSCLAVSGGLFLSHAFLPALDGPFPGIMPDAFESREGWLQNLFPLDMAPLASGGQEYSPSAETLRLKVAGDQILMNVSGSCDLDPLDAQLEFTLDVRFSLAAGGKAALCRVISAEEQHAVHGGSFFDIPVAGSLVKLLLQGLGGDLVQRLNRTLSHKEFLVDLNAVSWFGRKTVQLASARLEDCLLLEYSL